MTTSDIAAKPIAANAAHYDRVTMTFHWLTALAVVILFGTAFWWAVGICAASLIPVLFLLRAEGPKEDPQIAAVEVAEEFVEPIGA